MSSLVRRIQRMPTRTKMIARKDAKKYLGYLGQRDKFGSKVGVHNEIEVKKRAPRGSRRGVFSKKWLASRKEKSE